MPVRLRGFWRNVHFILRSKVLIPKQNLMSLCIQIISMVSPATNDLLLFRNFLTQFFNVLPFTLIWFSEKDHKCTMRAHAP